MSAPLSPRSCVTLSAFLGLLLVCLVGCSPDHYRRDADRTAYAIIDTAQREVLDQDEPFTIEPPADALRRKLQLAQDLPVAGPATVSVAALPPIPHWKAAAPPLDPLTPVAPPWARGEPLVLSLDDALAVAARYNRDYQARKEDVFLSALALDLQANDFRNLFFADGRVNYQASLAGPDVHGLAASATPAWQRQLRNGTLLTADFAVDLARLLTQGGASSLGLFADATITIPLLRGAGEHIVTEPLTQAERNVAYALWAFERYKRTLAVRVASDYLGVLRALDALDNAEANYRRLIASTRRARRLAEAGRLPQFQVDQARQDELRARDRWVSSQQDFRARLDGLKQILGLPTDAFIALRREELQRLAARGEALQAAVEQPISPAAVEDPDVPPAPALDGAAAEGPTTLPTVPPVRLVDEPVVLVPPDPIGGPLEIPEARAVGIALDNRLDLRTAMGRVYDAQRRVVVAADALQAGLTLTGAGAIGGRRGVGSGAADDAQLRFDEGVYTLGLLADAPLERTAERNAYRASLINLEASVRAAQALEDGVKQQIRDTLRRLLQARESYLIQVQALQLAERRVASTELLLQAGRAVIRDVLEAQEALLSAQNALTAALVNYRIAELELQRDMGVLDVDSEGLWREYEP